MMIPLQGLDGIGAPPASNQGIMSHAPLGLGFEFNADTQNPAHPRFRGDERIFGVISGRLTPYTSSRYATPGAVFSAPLSEASRL